MVKTSLRDLTSVPRPEKRELQHNVVLLAVHIFSKTILSPLTFIRLTYYVL